jgi:EmrB/QacA subfamily drug resistance transporter
MIQMSTPDSDTPFQITPEQIRTIYAGLMMATMLASLDGTIVNTALTTIVGELGGLRAYTWVGTSYLLTSTAITPLIGKLSDLYGRRIFVQLSVVIFIVASLVCAAANSMTTLVIGRALQGIGGGGIMAMSYVVIADIIAPRDRGRYVGAFMSVFAISSVAGPLLGGFFVDHMSWRWIFLINLPIGLVALYMSTSSLKIPVLKRRISIDYVGMSLLVGAVTGLILVFSWTSEEYGWTASINVALSAAVAVMTALFLWWEPRATSPVMPLHLFRNREVYTLSPLVAMLGGILMAVGTFIPLFLQAVTGISPTNSGLLLVPMMAAVTISSVSIGRVTSRTGSYRIFPVVGTGVGIIGVTVLCFIDNSATGVAFVIIGMVLVGTCVGSTMPVSSLAVQNSVEFHELGVASSVVVLFRSLGSVIGLAAFGAILNSQLSGNVDPKFLQQPRTISQLPEPARSETLNVLSNAISMIYKATVPMAIIAFLLALSLRDKKLSERSALDQTVEVLSS